MRWLDKLNKGLQKTARVLTFKTLSTDDLEESLLLADVGIKICDEAIQAVRENIPKTPMKCVQFCVRFLFKKCNLWPVL